jgi:hypothetical protein
MHPSDPLAPVRVAALITSIKGRLNVPYSTMERYAGPAYNTIQGWAAGTPAVQVQAVLRLLARLPASERHQLVDNACPCFPSLFARSRPRLGPPPRAGNAVMKRFRTANRSKSST